MYVFCGVSLKNTIHHTRAPLANSLFGISGLCTLTVVIRDTTMVTGSTRSIVTRSIVTRSRARVRLGLGLGLVSGDRVRVRVSIRVRF